MDPDLQTHLAFYLSGKRPSSGLEAPDGLHLRPALFAGYRDLGSLRYDFPLVLVSDQADGSFAMPLSCLIDSMLDKIAKGAHGERIRKQVLALEQAIRIHAAAAAPGDLLSAVWDQAAADLVKRQPLLADSLAQARVNRPLDGELVDCEASLPARLLGHAWSLTQARRAARFGQNIARLVLKLSDILKADFVNSDAGKSAENLKASFGSGPRDQFDFEAMSRILTESSPKKNLSPSRRSRVTSLLATLRSQHFFATPDSAADAYSFSFDTCSSALLAYRERLPRLIELARAMTIAELEINGEYDENRHDLLFESFGENGLQASDLALFPDYLVRLNVRDLNGPEQSTLLEVLAADLPIKILVQTDDVIEESPLGRGHLAFALRSRQVAGMAMALSGVFVLQSPASNLYQMRGSVQRGLDFAGPALFSVFSGAVSSMAALPAYLVGAAALESRVFPAFCFDPSAGHDWASRFSLATNPQADQDWPVHPFAYADEYHQAVTTQLPFTLIDFVACDTRYAKHFARVPRAHWSAGLAGAGDIVAQEERGHPGSVPTLLMVDPQDRLQKLIVDEKLIREARRCRSMWHSLQELAGIHNSHAQRLLDSERQAWLATARASEIVAPPEVAAGITAAPAGATAAPFESEVQRSPDEAYIETARCSSCNECTQINSNMFAYDNNRQAYIADVNAGTYAQLVEAAESCQVSIIHPGKPLNPNEAGLDDLLKRAALFV
jgi:ferredoxin